jgi:hypothetical protein
MRRTISIIPILLTFLLPSCGQQTSIPPIGSYSKIVLFTESGELDRLTESLVRELQHPIDYYTKVELQFGVRLASAHDFQKEGPAKNVVLFGIVRQGEIGNIIESFIGPDNVRKVLQGKNNVFRKLDYPVVGQFTVIVTASSRDYLETVVEKKGSVIRALIEEANRERLRNYLLTWENTELSEELRAKYGFDLRIPEFYELNQERKEVPGIELVRKMPHRGLTISWKSWKQRTFSLADSTALYDIRSDLAWKLYDKDVMRRELVFFSRDQLGSHDAIRMEGYWENSEDVYGGPFICFFIHDPLRSKLWIIDCLVYAPGFNKHTLLRELQAVAETFRL